MTGLSELERHVSGPVLRDEPLAGHTTLKVGGPAMALVRAESTQDLTAVAELCAAVDVPWLILGRGSNLLVADEGWPGIVVVLGRAFRGVDAIPSDEGRGGDGVAVIAGAAEPMPVLAKTVAGMGLAGMAFGVAIPGTLGGAVRMNAGAHGREMRDVLIEADVVRLAHGGRVEPVAAAELAMGYRHTALPDDAVVVRATLGLRRAPADSLAADMAEMRRWRREHQPINEPSCGSVFRNPEGDSAGRLIETAGMKGHRVGGAQVSAVHANFITVSAGASAADVYRVIGDVLDAVIRHHGIELETEVVVVGFEDAPSARSGPDGHAGRGGT